MAASSFIPAPLARADTPGEGRSDTVTVVFQSFADPTPLAHADTSRDVLPRGVVKRIGELKTFTAVPLIRVVEVDKGPWSRTRGRLCRVLSSSSHSTDDSP
ncbi:hypothetical protein TNCV_306121 [Trichonephila clavipes]|nr:hypothetical protein TNCV_306121 [Trichonephila clavipes]